MTLTPRSGSTRKLTPAPTPAPARIAEFIRWPQVANARARVAAGFYDRDDVRSRLVDALLEELRRR